MIDLKYNISRLYVSYDRWKELRPIGLRVTNINLYFNDNGKQYYTGAYSENKSKYSECCTNKNSIMIY